MKRTNAGLTAIRLLVLPLVATFAFAFTGCKHDPTTSSLDDKTGVNGWKELDPAHLDAGGGSAAEPGGRGAPGGNMNVKTAGALSFGPSLGGPADVPPPPAQSTRITAIDQDGVVTGTAVIDQNVSVGGDGARRLTVTGGDLFVAATVRALDATGAGRALTIEAPDGTIFVTGALDARGNGDGA